MSRKSPGKAHRQGISLVKLHRMFPDDDAARAWLETQLWPQGPYCPHCGSFNVQAGIKHRTMTHRCRDCPKRPQFSLKTGTIMQASNLGYQTWAIAIYLLTTNLKGIAAMKLHRDLELSYKSAWHLAHRLRRAFESSEAPVFQGPVEADEAYFGGKRRNMHKAKRKELAEAGRGTVGKTAVVGVKDRATNAVVAEVVERTDTETLQSVVVENTSPGATVYTDEASAYKGVPRAHEAVNHSAGEYVRGMAHSQGIESFWSLMKRGYVGTYHYMSAKHLQRYANEFAGRNNIREADTIDQMKTVVVGLVGKRLCYRELVADNGLPSGARGG